MFDTDFIRRAFPTMCTWWMYGFHINFDINYQLLQFSKMLVELPVLFAPLPSSSPPPFPPHWLAIMCSSLLNKASKFCQHLLWNPTVLIEGGCFCAAGVCTVIRFKEDLTVYGLLKQQQFPAVSAPCRHTLHQHRTTLVYISNQWNAGHRGVSLRDVCSQCKYTVLHTVSKVWTRTVAITQELSWQVEADTHITGDIHIMNIDSAHAHSVHMDSWKYSLVTATLLSFVLHPVSMILGPLIV